VKAMPAPLFAQSNCSTQRVVSEAAAGAYVAIKARPYAEHMECRSAESWARSNRSSPRLVASEPSARWRRLRGPITCTRTPLTSLRASP
jgi:hypothetical protein